MMKFRWQTAGNVHEDSLSVELIDSNGDIFAEIVRYDGRKELKINTFKNDMDLVVLEEFIRIARLRLDPFEDGASLSDARTTQFLSLE